MNGWTIELGDRCLLSASASIRYWGRWDRIRSVVRFQIILAQGEWSSAKEAKTIFKRCNTRQQQTFCDMGSVHVCYIGIICIHGEELHRQLAFHQKTEDLTMKQIFDIFEKWIAEQSDEICGVTTINWDDSSWKYHHRGNNWWFDVVQICCFRLDMKLQWL